MADEKIVEHVIENSGVPSWQVGLANAINDTYSFTMNSSLFIGLVPNFMRDYVWRYVRPCLQWLDGYVFSLHSEGTSGIVSTRIGKTLIGGLTKQIVGEKLILRLNEQQPNEIDQKNLKTTAKWVNDSKIIKPIYSAIGFSCASGTSLIKANHDIYGKVWWEGVRFDQCLYRTNFLGEIEDATFLIRGYTDTREGKNNNQYFLCEHRYYKDEKVGGKITKNADGTYDAEQKQIVRKAKVQYVVHRVRGTLNNGGADAPTINEQTSVKWDELPEWLRTNLKKDYSVLRLDEEQELGFSNLAVEPLINSYQDLSMPKAQHLGEGLLIDVISDMITYEVAASYKIRDMYLGKGTVYQPKSLSMGDVGGMQYRSGMNSPLNNVGESKIELLKGVDPDKQKAIVEQFEIRGDQWQAIMDDCIRNIATKWGMSPKVLSSYLLNSQTTMTATQIDSEDDISIAFISHTRSYFRESLNRLLETTLNYMGISTNITLDFASPSLINKDRIIDREIKLLDAGLITVEDAIRDIFPDLEEEQIQKRIADANYTREQQKQEEINEMNNDGSFGDEDLSGKNLNGSTELNDDFEDGRV